MIGLATHPVTNTGQLKDNHATHTLKAPVVKSATVCTKLH